MNSKIKILVLAQLPPPVHGVSTVNEAVIKSRLINEHFSIRCIPLQFASSISDLSSIRFSKFNKTILIALCLIKALVSGKYAFVYFTLSPVGLSFYRDLLFVLIMKAFRVKILYHLHGKGIRRAAESNNIKKFLYKFAFKDTSVIVLASTLSRDIETVYAGTPFVVNNGIPPLPAYCPCTRESMSVVQILYLSNIKRSKGIQVLLDSLSILRDKKLTFHVQLVGNDGDLNNSDLELIIKKMNLDIFVSALGPKYGADKNEVLKACDIFCLPTLNDAFPLVILEAMQCGKPVVSTFEGAIPDIVDDGNTGLLVRQKDSTELAEALQKLISNKKLRNDMGQRGLEKFFANYTLPKFEQNICEVFMRIAQ